jgi:hypothetical protein
MRSHPGRPCRPFGGLAVLSWAGAAGCMRPAVCSSNFPSVTHMITLTRCCLMNPGQPGPDIAGFDAQARLQDAYLDVEHE